MKKAHASREARIELLRAKAAVERQSVLYNAAVIRNSLTPAGIAKSLLPRRLTRARKSASSSGWLLEGFRVARRYPFLISGASAVLTRLGLKRGRWAALGGVAAVLLAWQMKRNMAGGHEGDFE